MQFQWVPWVMMRVKAGERSLLPAYARQKVEGRVAIHSPYERKPNKGGQLANKQIKRTTIITSL